MHLRGTLVASAALGLLAGLTFANRRADRWAEEANPPKGRFIEVDGIRLNIVEEGAGPPVLLVHGNAALVDDMELSGLVAELAPHHRVIVAGRPGFGYNERPNHRMWDTFRQAALLAHLIDELELDRPIVVGHSQGASVVAALGLDHPDKVRGLVLLSGYYAPEFQFNIAVGSMGSLPVYGEAVNATLGPPLIERLAPWIIRKVFEPAPVPPHFWDFPVELALRPPHLQASADDMNVMRRDAAAMLARYHTMEMPIALFCGEGDRIIDAVGQALAFQRECPHATLTVLPGTGHMIHHTHTHEIARAIEGLALRTQDDAGPRLVASL